MHTSTIILACTLDPALTGTVALLILALCVSAWLSGAETAFFSLAKGDLEKIDQSKSPSDLAIRTILGMENRLTATNRIANMIVRIGIVLIADRSIDRFAAFTGAGWEFTVKILSIVVLLLLLTEIVPRIAASRKPLGFARMASRPQMALIRLLKPLTTMLVRSGNALARALATRKPEISVDELSSAIGMTKDKSEEEKQMLTGVISFASTEVGEVMRPRIDIVALNIESGYETVRQTVIESGFSRIPVYEENLDRIKGVLYVKDLFAFTDGGDTFEWQSFLREAYFVPEQKKINELLGEFQSKKVHIAVVVDEYGATVGLVSLEDILEEIVGEILDESDVDEAGYVKIDGRTYVFDGKTSLNDFERIVGLDEDYFAEQSGDAESIAGLMLETRNGFLSRGESVTVRDIRFTVQSVEGRRINDVKVILPEPSADEREKQ